MTESVPAGAVSPVKRLLFAHWPLILAGAACFLVMFAQRRIGLSLRDEGFMWYGAQRLLHGELPLRDFQAYDPGRYFWASGWMAVLRDDGIVTLRIADTALAAITVMLAAYMVTIDRRDRSIAARLAVGAIFALWMQPHYKVADSFAAILQLFALARLIEWPSFRRYFQAGLCLGITAMIGINHALYGAVAGLITLVYLRKAPNREGRATAVTMGGLVGYAPMFVLAAVAPDFAGAFFDGIAQLFEIGTTNLPKSFPDPLAFMRGPLGGHLEGVAQSILSVSLVIVPLLWLFTLWRLRDPVVRAESSPVVPASLILSLPYAHYVISRADVPHAALSVLPVMAFVLALALRLKAPVQRWLAIFFVFGGSLLLTVREHPAYNLLKHTSMISVDAHGERLIVLPGDAAEIEAVREVSAMAGAASFFAGPYLPGAYALARHKAPVWEIYMLFPLVAWRQQNEIERLRAANVRFALISSDRVDDRPELGFRHTHPLLLAEIERRLQCSAKVPESPDMTILSASFPCTPPTARSARVAPAGRP